MMANQCNRYLTKNRLRSIIGPSETPLIREPVLQERAYDLLQQALPGNWVLCPLHAHEQGMDCLLEIVDETGALDGCCAWIRLQAMHSIRWNQRGRYRAGAVQPPSYYQGRHRSYPVFLLLADVLSEELYFLSVDTYIQAHFDEYLHKRQLHYRFDRQKDLFNKTNEHQLLSPYITAHRERQELENLLTLVLTHPELLRSGLESDETLMRLFQQVECLLQGPLAYWAFTNRTVYYLLHGLCQRLRLPGESMAATCDVCLTEPMKKIMCLWQTNYLMNTNTCY